MIFTLATLVTFARLCISFYFFASLFSETVEGLILCAILGHIVNLSDMLDGYVARKFKCESVFGSQLDATADRILEMGTFMMLAYLKWLPLWFPILFLTRGCLVDGIRAISYKQKQNSYSLISSKLNRALVSNRFMRTFYAGLKGYLPGTYVFAMIYAKTNPSAWLIHQHEWFIFRDIYMYLVAFFCILRAIPILIELGGQEPVYFRKF